MTDVEKAVERVKELVSTGLSYQESLQKVFHEFALTPLDLKQVKKFYHKSINN